MDWQYLAALSRIGALERELAEAQDRIRDLEERISSLALPEAELYADVGLLPDCPAIVVNAARMALLAHFLPDRWPIERRHEAAKCFRTAQTIFESIEASRREAGRSFDWKQYLKIESTPAICVGAPV